MRFYLRSYPPFLRLDGFTAEGAVFTVVHGILKDENNGRLNPALFAFGTGNTAPVEFLDDCLNRCPVDEAGDDKMPDFPLLVGKKPGASFVPVVAVRGITGGG